MGRNKEQFIIGSLIGVGVAYLPKILGVEFLKTLIDFIPTQLMKLFGDPTPPWFVKYLNVGDPTLWTVLVTAILVGIIMAFVIKH